MVHRGQDGGGWQRRGVVGGEFVKGFTDDFGHDCWQCADDDGQEKSRYKEKNGILWCEEAEEKPDGWLGAFG